MPLFKTILVDKNTKVLIWKITESIPNLSDNISLTDASKKRVFSMKSELHQKGFLSVRQLLKELNYQDADVYYDEFGKPFLKDGTHISITHSFVFSAIILSKKSEVGIDIEKQRDKIIKIAPKFTKLESYQHLANPLNLVKKLTMVWGAKESLYKIYGKKKIVFLKHIFIEDFTLSSAKTFGEIRYLGNTKRVEIRFLDFEGFSCVFGF